MESLVQCLPVLTTCLPLQKYKNRNKTKIILYKNIFKIFKTKKIEKEKMESEDRPSLNSQEKFNENTSAEFEPDSSEEENTNFPILYTNMRNCPCKICEMKNLFQ